MSLVQAMTHHIHPKRIGIVSYDFDPPIGGLGVLVRTYVDELKKLYPNDVYTVVSPSANADEKGPKIGHSRYRKAGGCPLFSLSLFFSLPSLIRTHGFDLVHVHSGSGGVFLLRRPPCKLVVTAHHTYRQEADLVYAFSPIKRLWKLFMALFEARTYRLADMVICVSRDTADEIITQYGIRADKVCVIENPVSVTNADALLQEPKNSNTVMFVGRLEARKGILMLLQAFFMLLKNVPGARLCIIGKNLLGSALHDAVQQYDIERSVEIMGFVPDPDRLREMVGATVVVVPSILEGFGLVAAEAMTLGTCVIASDAPGLRSIIRNGRTGISFPVGDARACAEAMKMALTDNRLREKLEREALMEAPIRFNVEKRSRDVSDVFSRILGK